MTSYQRANTEKLLTTPRSFRKSVYYAKQVLSEINDQKPLTADNSNNI
jgi:hypothetical protein